MTFDIDANGILTVSAKDKGTGKEQSITIDESGRMSDEEIDRAIRDAETYAAQDATRRDAMEVHAEAARLVQEVDAALAKSGKQLEKEEKKQVKADSNALRKLLSKKTEKLEETDIAAIRSRQRAARLLKRACEVFGVVASPARGLSRAVRFAARCKTLRQALALVRLRQGGQLP